MAKKESKKRCHKCREVKRLYTWRKHLYCNPCIVAIMRDEYSNPAPHGHEFEEREEDEALFRLEDRRVKK